MTNKKVRHHARMLRAISGQARWQVLMLLRNSENGLTTTDIAAILKATLSRVSHQLRILKGHGLVKTQRYGRNVVYALANPLIKDYIVLP
ncbi:MAG: metalloregulator ArsR/SmtB family transcription factor [Patescibacteria group bacterium]